MTSVLETNQIFLMLFDEDLAMFTRGSWKGCPWPKKEFQSAKPLYCYPNTRWLFNRVENDIATPKMHKQGQGHLIKIYSVFSVYYSSYL